MAENNGRTAKRRGRGRPFPKGESGNPGGRPKALREVLDLARAHTVRAIERLAELVESGDEGIALRAADVLLDRAWGKPQEVDLADRLAALEDKLGLTREGV